MPSIFSRLALSKNVREVMMVVILHWAMRRGHGFVAAGEIQIDRHFAR